MLNITLAVSAALLFALAGVSKAAVDILTHQEGNNIFESRGGWYDARTSWKLKYKDYDKGDLRPRFLGSTTVFVMFTDFWHAADAVYLAAFHIGGLLLGMLVGKLVGPAPLSMLVLLASSRLLFSGCFELCYSKLFRKQPAQV
jgi:hypothetical protein